MIRKKIRKIHAEHYDKLKPFLFGMILGLVAVVIALVAMQTEQKYLQLSDKKNNTHVSLGLMEYDFSGEKPVKKDNENLRGLRNLLTESAKKDVEHESCESSHYTVISSTEDEKQVLLGYGCDYPGARMLAVQNEGAWRTLSPTNRFDLFGIPECSHTDENQISKEIAPVCVNGLNEPGVQDLAYKVRQHYRLMKIIIGTKNQKKVSVVQGVFRDFLKDENIDIASHDAKSGVPDAPRDIETYNGALNRAEECYRIGGFDYSVGLESGLVERYGNYFEEAWAVIISSDGTKRIGYSSGLLLPSIVTKRMEAGEKHNDIMAYFDKKFNLPDDNRDTWSRYTGGHISRQVSLEEALRNALIQSASTERNLYRYEEQSQDDDFKRVGNGSPKRTLGMLPIVSLGPRCGY